MLFALLLACADASKDKTAATVAPSQPASPVEATAAPAEAKPAVIAGAESLVPTGTIAFTGAKVTRTHDGTLQSWKGELSVKDSTLVRTWFEVDIRSITAGIEKLDTHLKSPDFFDADAYPTGTFVSTAITPGAPTDNKLTGATHTIEGDLTLRGHTRHITFPAIVEVTPTEVKAKTEFFINRKDFGIEYPGKPDDLIRDEVTLKIDVSAPRTTGAASSTTSEDEAGSHPGVPGAAPTGTPDPAH